MEEPQMPEAPSWMTEGLHSIYEPRSIPQWSPADAYATLRADREALDQLRPFHGEAFKAVITRRVNDDGTYPLTTVVTFLMAVAQRSYHLTDGFIVAFDGWNVHVAAPIVRQQIDNLTRVIYVLSPGGAHAADELLAGGEFRKMVIPGTKDRLIDKKLVDLAAEWHEWLPAAYEDFSGDVHLSPQHIRHAIQLDGDRVSGGLPQYPATIPEPFLAELVGAMLLTTSTLLGYYEAYADS